TLNSILTPHIVNSFTVGFQYWNNVIDSDLRAPNVTFPPDKSITFGTNVNVPQQSYQRKWQFRDDISILKGNHSLKTGFDFVAEPQLGGFFENNPTPEFDFIDSPQDILNDKVKYPNGFATRGALQGMTATSGDPYFNISGAKMFGVYFQDDWKLSPRL